MISRYIQPRVKFPQLAIQTMIAFADNDIRRECWTAGGWCLRDDDTPGVPEADPLASAQARRAMRQSPPASGAQCEAHSG